MRTLYTNAQFWNAGEDIFNDLLVEDKIIIATGLTARQLPSDSFIDLNNAFVIPAFIDAHAHPIFGGRELSGPSITGLKTVPEILAEVKNFAENNPELAWIIGGAYEAAIIESGDFDAHWLDEVVSDRPVVLHAVDHHTVWVNTKALEAAGVNAKTPDPFGGSISRRSDGRAKGTFREPSAIAIILDAAPSDSIETDLRAIKKACLLYLNSGVTAAIDSWVEKDMAQAYLLAARTGDLTIAMNLSFLLTPLDWAGKINEFTLLRKAFGSLPDPDLVKANSVKFLADGALSAGTAALSEPYLDDPSSLGIKIWEDAELACAISAVDKLHFQVHIHAIGDAAVKQALDAIAVMIDVNPLWDRRPVIVHAQLINDEDFPRFAALGVIANIQPLWCYLDPMNKALILPRLGKARNDRQYPLRTLINHGATIAFGSDWPVTSERPLLALSVPVNRVEPDSTSEEAWSPAEAITIDESLTFYTKNAAYQLFREAQYGSLHVGKKADFLVLSQNPLAIPASEIARIEIRDFYRNGIKISGLNS